MGRDMTTRNCDVTTKNCDVAIAICDMCIQSTYILLHYKPQVYIL